MEENKASTVEEIEQPKKKKGKKIAIIVVSVILVLAVLFVAFSSYILVKGSKMDKLIVDEWFIVALSDDNGDVVEVVRNDEIDYKLELHKDNTGCVYVVEMGEQKDYVDFHWYYVEEKDGVIIYEVEDNDEPIAYLNYTAQDDEVTFILLNDDEDIFVFAR